MSGERRRELHRFFRGHGFEADRTETDLLRYVGKLRIGTHYIEVAWELPKSLDFISLPKLYIIDDPDGALKNVVAHLLDDFYCYAREGAKVLDRYNVAGTMQMCLERAKESLYDAIHKKNFSDELAEEFVQHWRAKGYCVSDLQMRGSYMGRVVKRDYGYVITDKQDRKAPAKSNLVWVERVDKPLTFPPRHKPPENIQEFLNWAEFIGTGLRKKFLQTLVDGFPKAIPDLYFRAPNAIVGVRVKLPPLVQATVRDAKTYERALIQQGDKVQVVRFASERADPDFLYSRNTGTNIFAKKRILLVGCGTIGGHLAKFLAQSGAGYKPGSLVLLDWQHFSPSNIGRHLLDIKAVHKAKAVALVESFADYPNLNMRAEIAHIEQVWDKYVGFDLIIDATGDEATSIALNHHFTKLRHAGKTVPAVLHVWLDGLGEATQALLVKDTEFACYKCLRPELEKEPRFSPLRPGYIPPQRPATCGDGVYMEYGVGAPAIAAGLAFTMATDFMRGNPGKLFRTLLIDSKNTVHVANRNPERSAKCPACGTSHTA